MKLIIRINATNRERIAATCRDKSRLATPNTGRPDGFTHVLRDKDLLLLPLLLDLPSALLLLLPLPQLPILIRLFLMGPGEVIAQVRLTPGRELSRRGLLQGMEAELVPMRL